MSARVGPAITKVFKAHSTSTTPKQHSRAAIRYTCKALHNRHFKTLSKITSNPSFHADHPNLCRLELHRRQATHPPCTRPLGETPSSAGGMCKTMPSSCLNTLLKSLAGLLLVVRPLASDSRKAQFARYFLDIWGNQHCFVSPGAKSNRHVLHPTIPLLVL